jgi:hypothetical protein
MSTMVGRRELKTAGVISRTLHATTPVYDLLQHRSEVELTAMLMSLAVAKLPGLALGCRLPQATATSDTIEQAVNSARHVLAAVGEHGIGLDEIMDKLVVNGAKLLI